MKISLPAVLLSLVLVAGLAAPTSADIVPGLYCQTLEHSFCELDYVPLVEVFCVGVPYGFKHDNPAEGPLGPLTPDEYLAAAAGGLINKVTLSLTIIGLEGREFVNVYVDPVGPQGYTKIGTITSNGVTTFDLQAVFGPTGGLDGLPSKVVLDGSVFGAAALTTSKLCVNVIPAPAAALLGVLGLGLVGWTKRRLS